MPVKRSPEELCWMAWAAGIMDGEGCIHLQKPRGREINARLLVAVTNTDRTMLEKLVALFGGHITAMGAIRAHHKPRFQWRLEGYTALDCLRRIQPWLITKAERAKWALLLSEFKGYPKVQAVVRERLLQLNQRGVA
jgi:hypothetical protein